MTPYEEKQKRQNWKLGLAAVIVSLLFHQLVFYSLEKAGLFKEEKEAPKMEVSLLQEKKIKKKEVKKPKVAQKKPAPKSSPKKPSPIKKPAFKPIPKLPQPVPAPKQPMQPSPIKPPPTPIVPPIGPQLPSPPSTGQTTTAPSAPTLQTKLNWGAFERTVKNAKQERLTHKIDSLKKRGGGYKFGKLSAKVQRSIQNHHSWVAGAPKEPIGTKSAIFANYLEVTHDKIHALFADSFLPSLVSLGANHPLNDFSLMTLVEFRIQANGTVDDIHVIKTSGHAVFDAAPVDTLYRASPFLPPPKSVLSYDNSVYFRWGFHRNQRKCGTFNATGYILKGPSGAPVPITPEQYQIIDG